MNLISQTEAGKIAGVSRQAISKIQNTGTYDFFVEGKVDIDSDHWKVYLQERESSLQGKPKQVAKSVKAKSKVKVKTTVTTPAKKKVVKNVPRGTSQKSGGKKSSKKAGKVKKKSVGQKFALTAGIDPRSMEATTPSQLKALTDIISKSLDMRIKLGEYMHRDIVDSYIDRISNEVNQFNYLGRSVSKTICEKLDRIGMEKEVEKIINPEVGEIILQLIKSCNDIKKI